MSDPRRSPPMEWMSAVDLSPWAGVEVFRRGAEDPVSVPEDAGIYLDMIQALCGYGSAVALDSALAAEDCSITLRPDDRLVISNNRVAGKLIVNTANASIYGFDHTVAVEIDPGDTLVADRSWRRGMLGADGQALRMQFLIEGEIGAFYAPSGRAAPMSIITALRVRGVVEDLDDTESCLEAWDLAANSSGIRWGLTDLGHVYWGWDGTDGAEEVIWLSDSFKRRLGFTGNEVQVIIGGGGGGLGAAGSYVMVADEPCPGVVVPSRPIAVQTLLLEEESAAVRLTDGSFSSNWIASYAGWLVEWMLDGPDSERDTHRLWMELRAVYVHAGEPITLCQSWGDPRRAIDQRTLAGGDAYTLTHTSDRNGYRGRILGRLHPEAAQDDRVVWDSVIRLRAPITTRITVRESGV